MQPPVASMAKMKRMRFKKMHTTILPQSSSHPSLAPMMYDQPSSQATILDAGRRRQSVLHGGATANNTSTYSFAPHGSSAYL